jgi:predicted flap endonuclease-1-like 5' DNA nuclease
MTAVEFLVEQLAKNGVLHSSDIAKAKEMEHEQMETTWNNAIDAELKDKWQSFDQFHNQTFKSE